MASAATPSVICLAACAAACVWLSAARPDPQPGAGGGPPDAVVRGPVAGRRLALVFTGHEFSEGGETILDELTRHRAKASFFLTGDFLANPQFQPLVRRIVRDGHYLGPHSDKHLLYCDWGADKRTLVTKAQFTADVRANLDKIARLGVERPRYFLPPYEHFNPDVARWTAEQGLTLVNFTPGTRSNADYTAEGAANFVPSRTIFESILARERQDPDGLSGFLLLLHVGAGPKRADKFHTRFGALLDALAEKGYRFVRVDALLDPAAGPPPAAPPAPGRTGGDGRGRAKDRAAAAAFGLRLDEARRAAPTVLADRAGVG